MTCARCYLTEGAADVRLCPWCNLALCERCLERHKCTRKRGSA